MKSTRYILAISALTLAAAFRTFACGDYYSNGPDGLPIFRSCTSEATEQWESGCRFQEYEREQNCLLWQDITSKSIPVADIEAVVYKATASDLGNLGDEKFAGNRFAEWLRSPKHSDDLDYLLVAKEIEETRNAMNDPWYYPYDGDEEHARLADLREKCLAYSGKRHADRYALQAARILIAIKDYNACRELWEGKVAALPQNIVTDMIASYAGGAYYRSGDRDKAVELFTRAQDIGSLINLKAWDDAEQTSRYSDPRVKELEYIFNRFPNSPLLSIRLQKYVKNREAYISELGAWDYTRTYIPVSARYRKFASPDDEDDERGFYNELKRFAAYAASAPKCRQKGMWHYALAYLEFLDSNVGAARAGLARAESAGGSPFIKESIRAFRMLLSAETDPVGPDYCARVVNDVKWLDGMLQRGSEAYEDGEWQFRNYMNWHFDYWQDVARKVLVGAACPRLKAAGYTTLALQLANYASNRVYQLHPLCEVDYSVPDYHVEKVTFDEYRKSTEQVNYYDYQSQFFNFIDGMKAADAAKYAERIARPASATDRYLNERGYIDTDYIYDIVGTLYLREMNYPEAAKWLARVSEGYQARTNVAKEGDLRLDPFKYQSDRQQLIADTADYKLQFAQKMVSLENIMRSDAEPNRKAGAKLRYAIGMRNSFGKCWPLTCYGWGYPYGNKCYFADRLNAKGRDDEDEEEFESQTVRSNKALLDKVLGRVDTLVAEALAEFTDPEESARAQLEMKNFKTVMDLYPTTKAAAFVRGHCDSYHDYQLAKR